MAAIPLVLLLLAPTAHRTVSPEGRHYLVVRLDEAEESATFALFRRAEADPRPLPDDPGRAAEGDARVAEGTLDFRPTGARVLDSRPAALLLRGAPRSPRFDFALLDATGVIAWRTTLRALVGDEEWKRLAQPSSWSLAGWWVEEEPRPRLWLVTGTRVTVVVELEDGARVAIPPDELRSTLVRAAQRPQLGPVAIRALGALGDDSAEALADLVATPDYLYRDDARVALTALSAGAVVEALLEEFPDADRATAEQILVSAIASGAEGLHERFAPHERQLLRVLERGTLAVEWLAAHFERYPTSLAVAPLLGQLKRAAPGDPRSRAIIAALRPCSGQDHGASREAWLEHCRPPR